MIQLIVFLPLLAAIVAGLSNRAFGIAFPKIVTTAGRGPRLGTLASRGATEGGVGGRDFHQMAMKSRTCDLRRRMLVVAAK